MHHCSKPTSLNTCCSAVSISSMPRGAASLPGSVTPTSWQSFLTLSGSTSSGSTPSVSSLPYSSASSFMTSCRTCFTGPDAAARFTPPSAEVLSPEGCAPPSAPGCNPREPAPAAAGPAPAAWALLGTLDKVFLLCGAMLALAALKLPCILLLSAACCCNSRSMQTHRMRPATNQVAAPNRLPCRYTSLTCHSQSGARMKLRGIARRETAVRMPTTVLHVARRSTKSSAGQSRTNNFANPFGFSKSMARGFLSSTSSR
mmetsp:Transcript_36505/g.81279  ORF Transcript_36505/g.81279 Transcript_36505/m.81279 type:complete len:258 (+) Transcript_36505:472-1245(+)